MASNEAVAKIRRLLEQSEKDRRTPKSAEAVARQQFEAYEFNTALPAVDQSPRARRLRTVSRFVSWYPWGNLVVTQFLDRRHASSVGMLGEDDLIELVERLGRLEEAAREGYDMPDAPSAV